MSPSDLVDSMLAVLFAVAAVCGAYRSVSSRGVGWRVRGDQLLHTAMALTMAVMPWSRGPVAHHTALVTFFAAAALWFPLTAVRGPGERRVTAVAGRLPSTAGMAAMAWMTSMTWAAHPHAAHPSTLARATTAALALYLAACALWSLLRIMPPLHTITDPPTGPARRQEPYTRFWDGSVALGTTIMLLMSH